MIIDTILFVILIWSILGLWIVDTYKLSITKKSQPNRLKRNTIQFLMGPMIWFCCIKFPGEPT